MLKKIFTLWLVAMTSVSVTALADDIIVRNKQGSEPEVLIDGTSISFSSEAKPFIDDNGRTQIPVRAIAEALNYQVDWDSLRQTVSISSNDRSITFQIGSETMLIDGSSVEMDTTAYIINDYTYIPLRAAGEAFGYSVHYTETDIDFNTPTATEFAAAAGFDDDNMLVTGINAINSDDLYEYDIAPDTYKSLLQTSPALSEDGQYIFRKDNIRISYEFYDFFKDKVFDMNNGLYEYKINSQDDEVAYYYSKLISNPASSVLLEYIPEHNDDSSIANIYICHFTETGEERGYIHHIGYAHVPINQHSIIKIDGLKNDRKYVVLIASRMAETANPTIRLINAE